MMSWLAAWIPGGAEGVPIPYSPRMDDGITIVLLCCFFLSAYVLSRSRRFLLQLVKDFLLHRERTSIFATSTAGDMRYLLLLILQTCILSGVCIFNYCNDIQPELVHHVPPFALLGLYIGISLLYLFLKWILYSVLGWIFFDESTTTLWLESYSTLLYYLGFTLFPFVLFIVYFDLSLQLTVIIGLILAFFTKILMFYKWFKLFCSNLHGSFLLILYFCALEIMQFIDGAIVLVGMYVFGVQKALYAIIAVFLVTKVSDSMIEGLKFSKQAYIITSKPQEISSEIMEKLDRGVTGIHGKGMYSDQDKLLLYCVVGRKEIVALKELVDSIDPDAFVIVSDVREVLGEGFIERK